MQFFHTHTVYFAVFNYFILRHNSSGKTKIGATALGALQGMHTFVSKRGKSFNLIMAPSHVTAKWVREIGETLPDTFAMVVRSISDFDRLHSMYQAGDKSVYAVFSKEKARDGYMRYPVVRYDRRARGFRCPDCGKVVQMVISDDGTKYLTNADQFYFQKEHRGNHTCESCGSPLWSAVNPGREIPWAKIGGYGWVYRDRAFQHMSKTKNEKLLAQLSEIADHPKGYWPVKGACRRYPLSTYIKKKYRGRVDGFLCDELHEYNNASGQGDAMAELFGVAKQFVGMTATLINGYSSGIFHLLYRLVPGLMRKDNKSYRKPSDFDAEYGVIENTYELVESDYNSNRRTTKRKTKSKKLPGVSPLVYSRFLLEYTAFLSLMDMGKDLPDYGFNKLLGLLINCNPNTIELLGCKPEHYFVLTPIGKQLIGQRKMFLSRRAINSFGGYAGQQLRRLENALAHDAYPAEVKERHIMGSCENAMFTFPERYRSFDPAQIRLSVGEAEGRPQVLADIAMEKVPLRVFTGMLGEFTEITRNYDKIHHRNKKKDDAHLNKHAMHLVRLYLMCLDILEREEIVTYREADHDLLMDIRSGCYQCADHTFSTEFYDLLNELEKRLEYARQNTSLPEAPDLARIEAFQMEVNERVVRDEI